MEKQIHEIANEIRKGIHYDCKCDECERLRNLLDYLVGVESRFDEFMEIYEKYKVSDTLCILSDKVKDFLREMEDYYLKFKEVRNSSQA